jgi:hypothetical protein
MDSDPDRRPAPGRWSVDRRSGSTVSRSDSDSSEQSFVRGTVSVVSVFLVGILEP